MRCSIKHCFRISMLFIFLWLFTILKVLEENEDVKNVVNNHGSKNSSKSLGDWQSITSKYLKEIHQRRKTWLTVGITSESREGQNGLLDTLASLYHASSTSEQRQMTVLVHLADSDPTWLRRTIFHISSLYQSQILTGQLLVIHAPPDAYPTVNNVQNEISQEQIYSKQNVDHAFLMSFATKLSTYFLLIEDNVFCAPNFVSHIRSKVNYRKPSTWVLLEFSNMGILGKLLHSRDLPLLAHFLLLFHKERPLDWLIFHFRTLLAQQSPILCRPFLFYHRLTHFTFENKTLTGHEEDLPDPYTLTGTVYTDMSFSDVHSPQEAYTLDESFFWSYSISSGNYLIVILNNPANLNRVQVRTGSIMDGKYILEKGQVELGYEPEGIPPKCTSFTLLGRLVQGQMDQLILKSVGYEVSCVKLAVNANQVGGLMIRHIYIWGENSRNIKDDQEDDES
ncbi:alpha-1,3-mannosyl-glycoprotein 4-beta-N-acetylglucosaminyltransferase-like protein MGAT4E [Mastomys coucha]|uniref:alpha-1,3-mannosyl-glycoprotein 4-beta-N-acetylglucosaminyltransferase-like protein MGAT4E n=1 Tax=Mastomys coucha TaxID=35658 RepID=UPI0012626393|nr:alpha-1,3-mannosyl-glycoprotein 4-beta-N-acetylglucosaminyltransferase-like protein MGAT4E [Mastomys coucha]XP_031239233.1 alpha-1,3-mannosyl-glycoprotein 4-beta-N-acetylglucosaminyltransferase-like protein MGAT4E [Mastomys coucha]XP_031239242.1 alpha-1,3-mannosyl-glycoprotein 4-beta-N-acetylglucosaminyltransferase-like protein MGAT4E [Mastomys coucha]XP_031239248.1 alpha-1,3-mannosyl-glycoprotein 4-beta-N-acetylglucosaminyltransferase-like protein MGAT4E [Mastomys coucha]XP_031239258.1 alph